MKSVRSKLCCSLVAVCALSATAAAGASAALPEFTGTFPQKFTGTTTAPDFTFEGTEFGYNKGTVSGEITGANKVADLVLKFSGGNREYNCLNSEPNKSKEDTALTTNELVGRIGYISKASKTVGLLLEPKSGVIAACSSEFFGKEEFAGSVIGALTPVNKSTSSLTLSIETEAGKNGTELLQAFEKFEGEEVLHHLEDIWSQKHRPLHMSVQMTLELSKAIELKA